MDGLRTRFLLRFYTAIVVLSALFCAFCATLAHADDVKWIQIFESDTSKISVAVSEISVQDINGLPIIQGFFQSTSPVLGLFEAWISSKQCFDAGSGNVVIQTLKQDVKGGIIKRDAKIDNFHWDWDGNAASDHIGRALCTYAVAVAGYPNARPRGLVDKLQKGTN
jgi:hypothetical protein